MNVMDDTISRQAAINALAKEMPSLTTPDGCGEFDHEIQIVDEAFVDCMRIINDLPSAQQWVPLSTDQLPKEGQQVFIQFKDGKDCPYFKVQVGYLGEHDIEDSNFRKIEVKKVWYTNQYYYDFDRVVAWMPRPELYKENEYVSVTD